MAFNVKKLELQFCLGCCLTIRITFRCVLYPRTPHFYIVNWGLQGYILFSYFCSKT